MIRSLVLFLAGAAALAAAETTGPSFAGRWQPDLAKSTSQKELKAAAGDPNVVAPPAPPAGGVSHPIEVIEQSGKQVKIAMLDPEGELANTLVLATDGSETVNQLSGGVMLHRSHTRWEGSSLVIEWQMEREGKTVLKGKDVRTLEPDGTQRLVRDLEDAKSKTHSVIVLKKQAGNPG
jgi:hypothetical protein